jgi:hypothetical protein
MSRPGNAGGGKNPDFWRAFEDGEVKAALDQQVLHPRPHPGKILHPMGSVARPHGLCRLLGQPGRAARRQDFRRLDARGRLRKALNAVCEATGEERVNAIGYCVRALPEQCRCRMGFDLHADVGALDLCLERVQRVGEEVGGGAVEKRIVTSAACQAPDKRNATTMATWPGVAIRILISWTPPCSTAPQAGDARECCYERMVTLSRPMFSISASTPKLELVPTTSP